MSENRGYFKYLLAMDCETTGLSFNTETPVFNNDIGERHQALSWGLIVADSETLEPVERLYLEVKWNQYSIEQRKLDPRFGRQAEEIHGLTREYLDSNGVTEQEAIEQIANKLIIPYWGWGNGMSNIRTLGHNVHTFDLPFFRDLFVRHQINLPFGNRHFDSNSVGFVTLNTKSSDELFDLIGYQQREGHNALEDAEMALGACRMIRKVVQKTLG